MILLAVAIGLAVLAVVRLEYGEGATAGFAFNYGNYAVAIVHGGDVGDKSTGAGIYFGDGFVLTAAHVAGAAAQIVPLTVVAAQEHALTTIVKAGSYEGVDVTLLRIEAAEIPPRLRNLAPLKLCAADPRPGQIVTVVAPGNIRHSVIVSPIVLPPNLREQLPTLIRDVYTTGNSGSGVFDSATRCLMGIMSRKIERPAWRMEDGLPKRYTEGLAKYFVPARDIAAFFPDLR